MAHRCPQTIQLTNHSAIGHVLTIWLPDMSGNQMPTVFANLQPNLLQTRIPSFNWRNDWSDVSKNISGNYYLKLFSDARCRLSQCFPLALSTCQSSVNLSLLIISRRKCSGLVTNFTPRTVASFKM